jgi:hypothetical protein
MWDVSRRGGGAAMNNPFVCYSPCANWPMPCPWYGTLGHWMVALILTCLLLWLWEKRTKTKKLISEVK